MKRCSSRREWRPDDCKWRGREMFFQLREVRPGAPNASKSSSAALRVILSMDEIILIEWNLPIAGKSQPNGRMQCSINAVRISPKDANESLFHLRLIGLTRAAYPRNSSIVILGYERMTPQLTSSSTSDCNCCKYFH